MPEFIGPRPHPAEVSHPRAGNILTAPFVFAGAAALTLAVELYSVGLNAADRLRHSH